MSDEEGGVTTLGMLSLKATSTLFPNLSDDEGHGPLCLMGKSSKVSTSSPSCPSSISSSSDIENDLDDEEADYKNLMIKEFGKKAYKEIKKLLEKLEKRKMIIKEHEEELDLEKERTRALEKSLVEEKVKIEKLELELSFVNDSLVRKSKEWSLANDSHASLKFELSELQERHLSLLSKYQELEVNFNSLFWKALRPNLRLVLTLVLLLVKVAQYALNLI